MARATPALCPKARRLHGSTYRRTRPDQATWPEIWGVSILCGIGFTMSLFISGLAFAGQQLLINEAKIGILLGSLISALAGYAIIRMSAKHPDDVRSPYID